MTLSILLAQVFGIYMIIWGLFGLLKRNVLSGILIEFFSNRPLKLVLYAFELLAGIFLVISHNIWVLDWPVIITIIGWGFAIEGAAGLLLPHRVVMRMARAFSGKTLWVWYGLAALVIGAYLTYAGFVVGV